MMARKMTSAQKYNGLKRQTEAAGMKITEVSGQLIVSDRKDYKSVKETYILPRNTNG